MDPQDTCVPRIPTPIVRGLIALSLLGAFLIVASVINPGDSSASDGKPADGPRYTEHLDSDQPTGGTVLLGTLLGTIYTVEIHGTDRGVRYTVFDDAGQTKIELATPEEVKSAIPELDLDSLRASQIGEVDTWDMPGGY